MAKICIDWKENIQSPVLRLWVVPLLVDTLPLSHNCPQRMYLLVLGEKRKNTRTEDLPQSVELGKLQNWADYFESLRSPGVEAETTEAVREA